MGDSIYLCGFIFAKFLQHPFRHLRMAVEGRPGSRQGICTMKPAAPQSRKTAHGRPQSIHYASSKAYDNPTASKAAPPGRFRSLPRFTRCPRVQTCACSSHGGAKYKKLHPHGSGPSAEQTPLVHDQEYDRQQDASMPGTLFPKTEKSSHQTDHTTQTQANPNRALVNPWFSDGPTWR